MGKLVPYLRHEVDSLRFSAVLATFHPDFGIIYGVHVNEVQLYRIFCDTPRMFSRLSRQQNLIYQIKTIKWSYEKLLCSATIISLRSTSVFNLH